MKIGKPHGSEDYARLSAVRAAVGDGFEIMTDCNQGFTVDESIRRAERLKSLILHGSKSRFRRMIWTVISA